MRYFDANYRTKVIFTLKGGEKNEARAKQQAAAKYAAAAAKPAKSAS
ncbi:hypothetical protein RKD52_002823 [Metabacillus sp. SLBN-84]